jgi:hypothetical protein
MTIQPIQAARQALNASPALDVQAQKKAACLLETQLVYQAFKAMDQGETPLLGTGMHGLSHFSDLFFQLLAEEVVRQKGLVSTEAVEGQSAQPQTARALANAPCLGSR